MSCFPCGGEPPVQINIGNNNTCNSTCRDSNCCLPFFRRRQRVKLEDVVNQVVLEAIDTKESKVKNAKCND